MEKWEQKTLTNELLQGMELGKELRSHLTQTSSPETRELLVQRILTSYDKALLILNWRGTMVQTPTALGATANAPESPLSNNSEEGLKDHQEHKDVSKKRKLMPTWTDQVRITSENQLQGAHEDGYSWRKYGQKGILGTKHPSTNRSYYRCTFCKSQNCLATKQVQRSEDDPPVLHITYRGKHTCTHANQSIPTPASPEKQGKKHENHHSQEAIFNFGANLRVNTDLDDNKVETPFPFASTSFSENHTFLPSVVDNNHLLGCYLPSFLSPSTLERNNFSLPTGQMNYFGGDQNLPPSASSIGEMISANTSATNSPIMNLDFSLDHVEIDPFILFDSQGFFSK